MPNCCGLNKKEDKVKPCGLIWEEFTWTRQREKTTIVTIVKPVIEKALLTAAVLSPAAPLFETVPLCSPPCMYWAWVVWYRISHWLVQSSCPAGCGSYPCPSRTQNTNKELEPDKLVLWGFFSLCKNEQDSCQETMSKRPTAAYGFPTKGQTH